MKTCTAMQSAYLAYLASYFGIPFWGAPDYYMMDCWGTFFADSCD